MKIIIRGVPPYDGAYPIDLETLTNREVKLVKDTSGYTPPEYLNAWRRGDNSFWVAIAFVALRRAGHAPVNEDAIWDAPAGSGIEVAFDDAEDDAVPPPPPSDSDEPALSGSSTPSGGPFPDDSPPESPPSLVSIGAQSSEMHAG